MCQSGTRVAPGSSPRVPFRHCPSRPGVAGLPEQHSAARGRGKNVPIDLLETADEIAQALRHGMRVDDRAFDRFLPLPLRKASYQYWTSVKVATRVGEWLSGAGVRRVLDVGSGPGKLCVVGALTAPLQFIGLEHRAHLVDAARQLATTFGVQHRVRFIRGDLDAFPGLDAFDALYLYNPFGENLFLPKDHLDDTVEVSRERFHREIRRLEAILTELSPGAHVVTHNGFGGRVPSSYTLERTERAGVNQLRLWRQTERGSEGQYWDETEESLRDGDITEPY